MDQIESHDPAVDKLGVSAHHAVDRMTSLASSAAERFGRGRTQLNAAGAEAVTSARGYVRANPIVAITLAAAVGFVLSKMMKSR